MFRHGFGGQIFVGICKDFDKINFWGGGAFYFCIEKNDEPADIATDPYFPDSILFSIFLNDLKVPTSTNRHRAVKHFPIQPKNVGSNLPGGNFCK